jgi:hypothetical protein
LSAPAYQRAWYAPANSPLALLEGVEAATRFCTGVPFGSGQPTQQMARVLSDPTTYTAQSGWKIDWDGGGEAVQPQDANFDGSASSFVGFNDWANIRLNQISAGGLGGGTEDFVLVANPAADELFGLGGDDLFGLGGDELFVLGGDDLFGLGGDDLFGLGGDELFGLGGDGLFALGGDDLFGLGGDDLFGLGGDAQPEPTYAGAKGLGRTEPSELSACTLRAPNEVGANGCSDETAQPFTPQYHRVRVSWTAATVGHLDPNLGYEVQRKRADIQNGTWEAVGSTTTNHIVDSAILPRLLFVYRVRAHFDDPTGASAWSYLRIPFEAQNDVPVARADSYVVAKNATNTVTIPKPGVLGKACTSATQCTTDIPGTLGDPSSDNPADYVGQRAVFVAGSGPFIKGTNTPIGTLSWNSTNDGGFTLTYPSSFVGSITFKYKANDGVSSLYAGVLMNGKDGNNEKFSPEVTVTIEIKKK